MKIADIRPRSCSGVTVWLMIERQTALMLSAAPAIASSAAAGQIERHEAGAGDRQAPDGDRADHDPAEPARVLDPAGRERGDRRARATRDA